MNILITHLDLDGVGSLILNDYYSIAFDKVVIVSYNEISTKTGEFIFPLVCKLTKDDSVTVTDIAMVPELYGYITKNSKEYIVFDHHDDTEKVKDDPNVHYRKDRSGTWIYFNHIMGGKRVPIKVQRLVDLISTYDTYDDESPLWEEAQNMNRLFYKIYIWGSKDNNIAVQKFINLQSGKLKSPLYKDFIFTDYEYQKIQEVIEQEASLLKKARVMIKKRIDNMGNSFGVIILPSKISITCYNLLKENPDMEYIVAINSYKGINGQVSVRAQKKGKVNVNFLKGIKGHEKAGGGEFDVNFLMDFWNLNARHLEYEPVVV